MPALDFVVIVTAASVVAGLLGSVAGLGGGFVIVPVLTLGFHVSIRLAIGASIIAVIATSSGAAASYVRDRMTNLRAGMFLEVATTLGALCGAYLTTIMPERILFILFGVVVAYSGMVMYLKRVVREPVYATNDRIAAYLDLGGSYFDDAEGRLVTYGVTGTGRGLSLMYVAGMLSALLGIGAGTLKVPAMDLAMHMPIKASTATSNFMIGVTAAASAGVYFTRGQIDPVIAGPVAVGVVAGSLIGARLLSRIEASKIRLLFVVIMAVVAVEMLMRGL